MEKTKFYSFKSGNLCKGCRQCVQGRKLVLFVTGICCRKCDYCPLSDDKYGKDVVFANERSVKSLKDVILEAEACSSRGCGITGGDPLCKLDRTLKYIRGLKKEFGKNFHIHLYTSFDLVDEKKLSRLYDAGLDEIRFHVSDEFWDKIEIAKKFKWKVGIEVPVIPGTFFKMKRMVDHFNSKVDFINLNELEVADNKISNLRSRFKTKDDISYAVKGSEELGLKLMRYCEKKGYKLDVHLCTAKLKDSVQLASRLKLRAKNTAKEYDVIDDEGLLVRGAVYCKGLSSVKRWMMQNFDIPESLIEIDKVRKRILTGGWIVDELSEDLKKKGLKVAIVREYPTWDCMNVELDWL